MSVNKIPARETVTCDFCGITDAELGRSIPSQVKFIERARGEPIIVVPRLSWERDICPDCVKLFNEQVNAFIAERWANADWKQTPNK